MERQTNGNAVMSPEDFAAWGQGIAYVRGVHETPPGEKAPRAIFGIFAADGERIGTAPTRDLAFAAIRQNDLEPVDAV
jgi:hypothetical protein